MEKQGIFPGILAGIFTRYSGGTTLVLRSIYTAALVHRVFTQKEVDRLFF